MATKRTYTCDLCHMSMEPKDGIGVRWGHDAEGECMQKRPVHDAGTHICTRCVKQFQRMFSKEGLEPL